MKFQFISTGILKGPYSQLWFRKDIATDLINRTSHLYFSIGLYDDAQYNHLHLTTKAIEKKAYTIAEQHPHDSKVVIKKIGADEIDFGDHKKPVGRPPLYISEKLYYLLEEYYQKKRATTSAYFLLLSIKNFNIPLLNSEYLTLYEQRVSNYDVQKFRAYLTSLTEKIILNNQIEDSYNATVRQHLEFTLENLAHHIELALSFLDDQKPVGMTKRALERAKHTCDNETAFIDSLKNEFQKGKFNPEWYFKTHPDFAENYIKFHEEMEEWREQIFQSNDLN